MDFISDLFRGRDWIYKLPRGKHKLNRYHWYNMVLPSPWPILLGTNTLPIILGLVGYLQGINNSLEVFITGVLSFLFIYTLWNRDIIRESTFMGVHTKQVDANTILGFKLFLFSEIMLFFSFFWAHLYSALYPSVFIGLSWPPIGLANLLLDPFDIPLTNTVILVYSGFTVTLSHLYLRRGSIFLSAVSMLVTVLFGLAFLYIQYTEYTNAEFDISDGIYGSTFYMLTGFHGGHVIIGVTALIITLIRLLELHFSSYSHTGFKLALIYWHFVDVVWIFVFLIVYVLGYDLTYPNSVYYFPSNDIMGCIVNLDQAFFGKWWRGSNIISIYNLNYLQEPILFQQLAHFQIRSNIFIKDAYKIKCDYGIDIYTKYSTYKSYIFTKKITQFTKSEFYRDFPNSFINDQNMLNTKKLLEFFKDWRLSYSAYLIEHENLVKDREAELRDYLADKRDEQMWLEHKLNECQRLQRYKENLRYREEHPWLAAFSLDVLMSQQSLIDQPFSIPKKMPPRRDFYYYKAMQDYAKIDHEKLSIRTKRILHKAYIFKFLPSFLIYAEYGVEGLNNIQAKLILFLKAVKEQDNYKTDIRYIREFVMCILYDPKQDYIPNVIHPYIIAAKVIPAAIFDTKIKWQ